MIVTLTAFLEDIPGHAYTFNLDLIELSDASAEIIAKELLRCLSEHDFEDFFTSVLLPLLATELP